MKTGFQAALRLADGIDRAQPEARLCCSQGPADQRRADCRQRDGAAAAVRGCGLGAAVPAEPIPKPEFSEPKKNLMSYPHRIAQWYSLAIVVFAGDQTAKTYIEMTTPLRWSHEVTSFFNLVHVLNPGAAFSFLAGAGGWQRWFFLAIALAASTWLMWMLLRPQRRLEALSYSLILGGALGNAFDRAVRGQVIDYLDFHLRSWHWPAFNIADMAIVGGAIALVLQSLVSDDKLTAEKATR